MRKKILIGLSAVVVLALIAFGVLLWNINPLIESFRPQITAAVSDTIGQPVRLGEMKVRFVPSVGIEVSDVALENNQAGASLKKLILSTSLAQLLGGNVVVQDLAVEDANLTIVRKQDSSISVGGVELVAPKDSQPPAAVSAPQTSGSKSAEQPEQSKGSLAFQVQNARVRNVNLKWIDEAVSPPQQVSLTDLRADVRDIGTKGQGNFSVFTSCLSKSKDNVSLSGVVNLANMDFTKASGNISLKLGDLDLEKIIALAAAYGVKIDGLSVSNTASLTLNAETVPGGLKINSELDAASAGISFKELFKKPAGQTLGLHVDALGTLTGNANVEKLALSLGSIEVDFPLSFQPNGPVQVKIQTTDLGLSEVEKFVAAAKPFALKGMLSTDISIRLASIPKDSSPVQPELGGQLKLSDVGATVSLPADKQESAQPLKPLNISGLSGAVDLQNDSVTAKDVKMNIAGQPLTVSTKVSKLKDPTLAFVVKSDRFELAPVLASVMADTSRLSSSFLGGLQLSGTFASGSKHADINLALGKSELGGANIDEVQLKANYSPAKLLLKPSTIRAFSGQVKIQAEVGQGENKSLAAKMSGTGINVGELSNAAAPGAEYALEGQMNELEVDVRGDSSQMPNSLQGPARFSVLDGAITGINLLGSTLGQISNIPGVQGALGSFIPPEHQSLLTASSTAFDELLGDFQLKNSKININQAVLRHALYNVSGTGWAGFDGSCKIKAQMKLSQTLAERMILTQPKLKLLLDRNKNIVIPIVIKKSPGGSTIVIPDTSQLLKRAAGNTAKEAAGRALDRVTPGLGQALDSLW